MKKTFALIACCILPTPYCCFAQMQPADSLPGTYAGQYWFKQPTTNPWTITPDTLYVQSNIDSVNCIVQDGDIINFFCSCIYYSDYYSCNSVAPSNNYVKFYSGDSVCIINDNVPQSPPNSNYSMRFYGKRISNKTTGINELVNNEQVNVYPNPVNGIITIESKMLLNEGTEIKITDATGREIKNEKLKIQNIKAEINVNDLQKGIYLLKITTGKEIIIKKIIIN